MVIHVKVLCHFVPVELAVICLSFLSNFEKAKKKYLCREVLLLVLYISTY